MILPDVNLLVYAYDRGAPAHASARRWWEALLNGTGAVGVPWSVAFGYIRIMTNPRVRAVPITAASAIADVRTWLARPTVSLLEPGPRHLEILDSLLTQAGAAGNLVTDAHLAALAIEHQCEIHSNDTDFARFPGLRWSNPL